MMTSSIKQTQYAAELPMQMLLEKILVVLLALFLFGIALRFLYAGPSGVLKALIAFVLGVICLFALRKGHTR
jgi:hypothetical protein